MAYTDAVPSKAARAARAYTPSPGMATSRTSIRFKLYSLVPVTLLAVGVAVGIGLYVQSRYTIGGPVDAEMALHEVFLAEIEPAVLVPSLTYIAVLEAEVEKKPEVKEERKEEDEKTVSGSYGMTGGNNWKMSLH